MTIKRYQFRAIGATIDKLTKPLFGKRGFERTTVLTDWPDIVGTILARHSAPERIQYPAGERSRGTLHLRVGASSLALELQHLEPQLIEKINGHFGFQAVSRIKIIQGPVPDRPKREEPASRELDDQAKTSLNHRLQSVTDPELREALEALGSQILKGRPA